MAAHTTPLPVRALAHKAMSLIQHSTTLPYLLQILARLSKTSLDLDRFVTAKFLRRCFSRSSTQSLLLGRALFDWIPAPDAFLWNTPPRTYLQCRNPAESLRLLRRMRRCDGVALDSFSLSLALQACEMLHSLVDVFVQTALVKMYGKAGAVDLARMIFDEMPERDLVSYNVMLASMLQAIAPERLVTLWKMYMVFCLGLSTMDAWSTYWEEQDMLRREEDLQKQCIAYTTHI